MQLVRRRLAKLAKSELKVAAAAAVVGPEVPFELLEAATGLDEDALLDALQVLLARRILVESRDDPDLFLFPSKVVRDVLTAEIFERRRRRIHERIAQRLEDRAERRPEDVVALAHHWLAAGCGDRALGWLIDYAGPMEEALKTVWKIVTDGDHDLPRRKIEENAFTGVPKELSGLPAPGDPGTEAARKAIMDSIQESCGSTLGGPHRPGQAFGRLHDDASLQEGGHRCCLRSNHERVVNRFPSVSSVEESPSPAGEGLFVRIFETRDS